MSPQVETLGCVTPCWYDLANCLPYACKVALVNGAKRSKFALVKSLSFKDGLLVR